MKNALKIVGKLVSFACELAEGGHGESILSFVGLLVVASKDVPVHAGLLALERILVPGVTG